MADPRDVVSVDRVIPGPPEPIFELLADPRRHPDIDDSYSVFTRSDPPGRLALGSSFKMQMKAGKRYYMTYEVVEFEEGRRIAWQPRPRRGRLRRSLASEIWRYELDPAGGGTRVRETWDISEDRLKFLVRPAAQKTRKAMAVTLECIEQLVTRAA
jgi:uncharacterized protein YndB with AHSA1/START domain